jgi:hypothetical protein
MRNRLLAALITTAAMAVLVIPASSALADGMNGRIAFSSDRSGMLAIWTINPDGTGATQLAHHDTNIQDSRPVLSAAAPAIVLIAAAQTLARRTPDHGPTRA